MSRKSRPNVLHNLPDSLAEFVELIVKKMRYRRKVRGEVMAELGGHFADALTECATAEERERKGRELIEGFGDAKLLGVLCRRSKKRCRPLWRTFVARSFQGVGGVFVCLVLYIIWFFSGTPAITTDYIAEFNEAVRPAADESLNAAPFYIEAAERVKDLCEELSTAISKVDEERSGSDKEMVRQWLEQNSETLAVVRAGAEKPHLWMTYKNPKGTDLLGVLMSYLGDYRALADCLCWSAVLRAEEGEYGRAFDNLIAAFRVGAQIKGNLTVVEQLVGIRTKEVAIDTLDGILSQYGKSVKAGTLRDLQEGLEEAIDGEDSAIRFVGERFFMYDQIQRCFTEDRLGGGHLSIKAVLKALPLAGGGEDYFIEKMVPRMPHIFFTHPNKTETRESADKFYTFLEECAMKTPFEMRTQQIDIQAASQQVTKGNILLEIMTPAFSRIIELGHRDRANGEATGAVIAVIRYEKERGSLPDSLEELVEKNYLERMPIDPYSDEPLVYRKAGDDFTLYSVGENFDDDGGVRGRDRRGRRKLWGSSGDAVFWPADKDESE